MMKSMKAMKVALKRPAAKDESSDDDSDDDSDDAAPPKKVLRRPATVESFLHSSKGDQFDVDDDVTYIKRDKNVAQWFRDHEDELSPVIKGRAYSCFLVH